MMPRPSTVLLPLLACLSCAPGGDVFAPFHERRARSLEEVEVMRASLPYGKIVLDHEPYFMAATGAPRFRVELSRDGSAKLYGHPWNHGWGDFVGHVFLGEYARLSELIAKSGIERLERDYSSDGFHGGTYELRLEDGGGRVVQEIHEYDETAPSPFWTVKCAIEAVMNRIAWRPAPTADANEETPMSRRDANERVVRAYVDAFNRGDLDALRALFAEDAEIQGVLGQGQMDAILPIWRQLVEGYGMRLTIEDLVVEGDVVAVRYTERGTFRAPAFGREPTGRSYELVAMEWFEIVDGRIHRRWGARDAASQARQLGL